MSSNNKCNFCNTGTPICHYTFPTGARFNCCSACAPLLADFGEESMRALERHGRTSGEQLSQSDRLRRQPRRRRGMTPDELKASLTRCAEVNRRLALQQIAPKTTELSLGVALNKDDLQPVALKRRVPGRLYLNAEAKRYVEAATAGAFGSGGPARRPA